ncbi:Ig-like domain repeat protein [Kitasatospora sp. NPDC002227]|uniref:Ig-like domain repeat protein n=1 Tax=Kitasatospora sp. NPDC002227 TaxID=3154773 RepID=UPI0033267CC9
MAPTGPNPAQPPSRSAIRRLLGAAVPLCLAAVPLTALPQPASAETAPAHQDVSSYQTRPHRPVSPGGPRTAQPRLSSAGVFTLDATVAAGSSGGQEPAIAVNPANPKQIAITRFTFPWNSNADLLYSTDGGITWSEESTIPAPPGLDDTAGCPCDQTIDYGRDGRLYGTFLTDLQTTDSMGNVTSTKTRIVTGSTTDPTNASSWSWNGNPAQVISSQVSTTANPSNVDQPWLIVNRDTADSTKDNVYVGFQDFSNATTRVGVSTQNASPVNITKNNKAGTMTLAGTNGGMRVAGDPRNGTVYSLYQQSSGTADPWSVTYRLNRSTDAGSTWTLGGNSDGVVVDTVNSDQGFVNNTQNSPTYEWGGNNALFGGVDHLAVDPSNGDVYVVYGQDASGNNQIKIRRITFDGSGNPTVGAVSDVSTSTNAAMPSVAVLSDGTVGVLYTTSDGTNTSGFPTFSAHLARSTDHGATFSDTTLQSFATPKSDGTSKERELGDFQQLKAVGTTFYGVFPGNTTPNATSTPAVDAMFFSVPQQTQTSLSSSANSSVYGQPVTFTATVKPVPDGGTVSFTVDGNALGSAVPVDTTTGQATSASISSLTVGDHNVVAVYSGDGDFKGSTAATLVQHVDQAAVATTLTPSPSPSGFGQPVTFTDVVCPAAPSTDPTLPPSGTVTFRDGTTLLGTGTLAAGGGTHCAQAQITFANLLPGSHTITAKYSGDTDYLAGGLESITHTVTCTRTITGQVNGAVFAGSGSTCLINATVNGTVHGAPGSGLFISNSTVRGSVLSSNGSLFALCGSTVNGGSVNVSGASGFVLVGDPADDGCAGNTVNGSVLLSNNHSGTEVIGNHITGSVQVNGTTGTGPFPGDDRAEIENNTIGGGLSCSANTPPPTNGGNPNTVHGPRAGQCSTL